MTDITNIESEPLQDQLAVIVASSPLEKTKAEQLKEMFVPYLDGMHKLEKKIAAIDKENPTKIDIAIARETRLAISKNRTAAEKKKDELKQSVLIEGRIIDSFFGVINNTSKSIELSLSNIEKAAEIKEAARKKQVATERTEQLSVYEIDLTGYDLGAMSDATFEQLLENTKAGHEKRVEDKRIEEELKVQREANERLHKERKEMLLPVWNFTTPIDDYSMLTVENFEAMLSSARQLKEQHEVKHQRIKEENERLKKEAEEKELQLQREREAAALALKEKNELQHKRYNALQPYLAFTSANPLTLYDITTEAFDAILFDAQALFNKDKQEREAKELQAKKRNTELRPYIIFIRDYGKMLNLPEDEYVKELADVVKGAEDHWEYERKEQIRKQNDADKLKQLQDDVARAELAKKKAERAPDKEKLRALANDITSYELPTVKSEEADKILTNVSSLLNKVAAYIHQNIELL